MHGVLRPKVKIVGGFFESRLNCLGKGQESSFAHPDKNIQPIGG